MRRRSLSLCAFCVLSESLHPKDRASPSRWILNVQTPRSHELFTGGDVELFKEVRTQCLQLHPRLMNFSPKNTDSEPGMAVTAFSPEIEAECDALYKRMYEQEISVDKVVTALRQAKESDNQHDHEFFACFLHGLFDEHRFFNTYPANELALTASLFGDLIQYHLIDFVPLGIAVRYVLDALRNPPDSNWFRFGIQALARFQSRLSEWPQLAHSILSIPHVQQLHPDVANIARQALLQREENGGGGTAPGGVDIGSMVGDALEPATAEQQPLEPERHAFTAIRVEEDGGDPDAPDEQTSDKILFIVNNLAPTNFENKVQDMLDRIEPVHFAWFAHYLVAQRVSIEPNNHQLYQQFLEALKMPALVKRVLYETFVKLATLLNSDKTVQSSTERTLLKNLGSWLGGLTLAKDKPIKHSNIAFKQLLIEGYDSNRLIVAIPFVCKVLEQCSKSRVFRPPNPWLMAILRLLVELYQFAELKLNLKFEIEVLCKSLDIDLKDVEPTDILRNRSQEIAAREAQAAGQAQAQAAALAAAAAGGAQPGMSSASVELALANLAAQQQQQQQQQQQLGGHELEEHALRAGFGNAPAGAAHHALPAAGSQGEAGRVPPMLGSNQAGYSLSLQGASFPLSPRPASRTDSLSVRRHRLGCAPEPPGSRRLQLATADVCDEPGAQARRLPGHRPRDPRDHRARRRALGHHRGHLDSRVDDEGLCDGRRRGQDGHRRASYGAEPRRQLGAGHLQGAAPSEYGRPRPHAAPAEWIHGRELA
jgi:CCR4-NOT transcription complex subunit 1